MRIAALFLLLSLAPVFAQQEDPDQLLQTAIDEQQHGDYAAAIRDYRQVLAVRPSLVEAKANLGAALAHIGQFDEAISIYQSVLPSLSYKNPILLNLGLAYYKKNDFQNARVQFRNLHDLEPANSQVSILLADTDVRLNAPASAIVLLEPLASANADNPDFQFVYGSALIGGGRRDEGLSLVEKVAEQTHNPLAYLLAGTTHLEKNEFEIARHDLEAALNLDSNLPHIFTLVGTARDKTGDAKAAEPALREALRRNPDDFEANLTLGAILYKRRDLDQARNYLEKAVKLNPTDPVARYELAMMNSAANQYAVAAQELEQIVKDQPNWLDPHIELATLYYKLHRPEDGAREREIVQKLTAAQQKPPHGAQ